MKALINNFAGGSPIELSANVNPDIGPLVNIIQSSAGLRFQHSMTPAQAREMAEALVEMAYSLDEVIQ